MCTGSRGFEPGSWDRKMPMWKCDLGFFDEPSPISSVPGIRDTYCGNAVRLDMPFMPGLDRMAGES